MRNKTINGHGDITELKPTQYLEDSSTSNRDRDNVALIILNSPLEDLDYFRRLYTYASYVVCADGGANRLYDLLTFAFSDHAWDVALRKYLPHSIHGDLDSISSHVRDSYSKLGVEITQDPDQYSTDFGKAIKKVFEMKPRIREILVLGSLGGRVDQGVGLLHELHREQYHRHPNIRFWLFSEASISVILEQGSTVLKTDLSLGIIERNVGILPIYGPAAISTKGFEWDVEDWKTQMGGTLSTSNHIVRDQVEVSTDQPVLFTVERVKT